MKRFLLATAALVFAAGVSAQTFDHTHSAFTALLKKHVVVVDGGKTTKVKYADFKKEEPQLKAYLDGLSAVKETEFNAWNKAQHNCWAWSTKNASIISMANTTDRFCAPCP